MTLDDALRVLMREHLSDFIYNIRERVGADASYTGNSWDHPRVKDWSDACMIIQDYLKSKETA